MRTRKEKIPTGKTLYKEKIAYMRECGYKPVKPMDFYRDLFPEGSFEREGHPEDNKGNGMLVQLPGDEGGHPTNRIVFDDLSTLQDYIGQPNVIISPVSYSGRRRNAKNARFCHAIAIDIDLVGRQQLANILHQAYCEVIANPTYFVISGAGVHLYYIFSDPIPMYEKYQRYLRTLKHALTERVWNDYTSLHGNDNRQFQGIIQGFRMVGSQSKLGKNYPVKAYKINANATVDVDYLMKTIPEGNVFESRKKVDKAAQSCVELFNDKKYVDELSAALMKENKLSMDEAKRLYPDWYQRIVVNKEEPKHWTCKRALYEWWFNKLRSEIKIGHRYFGIFVLSIYAQKCGISDEQLRADAYSLLDEMEALTDTPDNHFTKKDIEAAINSSKVNLARFPRDVISNLTGIKIQANKRNHRTQVKHLERARAVQSFDYPDGSWRNQDGRPKGSGTAEGIVQYWQEQHPDGRKADCIRDTGLSKPTVYKWWRD